MAAIDPELLALLGDDWMVGDRAVAAVAEDSPGVGETVFGMAREEDVIERDEEGDMRDEVCMAVGFAEKELLNKADAPEGAAKRGLNPRERWLLSITEAFQDLSDKGIKIQGGTHDLIMEKGGEVADIDFVNPVGLIVGRIVLDKKGRKYEINASTVETVYKKLKTTLNKYDIIRYARWWINELK